MQRLQHFAPAKATTRKMLSRHRVALASALLGYPFPLTTAHQFHFSLFELLSEFLEFAGIHQLARFWKHLGFLFFGMMFNDILQHLCLRREFIRIFVRIPDLRQHHVNDMVFFERFVIQMFALFTLCRLVERRIENLFLDLRMNFQFILDLRKKFKAFITIFGRFELLQQLTNVLVILFQKSNSVLARNGCCDDYCSAFSSLQAWSSPLML